MAPTGTIEAERDSAMSGFLLRLGEFRGGLEKELADFFDRKLREVSEAGSGFAAGRTG